VSTQVDILVIGGGIVGTTVARELQASGRSVTLIEKGALGHGCSLGNAGWITPCFAMPLPQPGMLLKSIGWLLDNQSPLYIHPSFDPGLVRWLWRFLLSMNRRKMLRSIEVLTETSKYSLEFYRKLETRKPGLGFEKRGLLMVSSTSEGLDSAITEMELMAERGIPGRKLSQQEALSLEPSLKPLIRGGVFFPEEAQIDPLQATLAVAREFSELGGKILEHHEVFDFELAKKYMNSPGSRPRIQKVRTTQGDFEPDLVVLAAGSWSPEIVRKLRLSVPILGGKGYSMSLTSNNSPKLPIMIVERKIAVTPFQDRLRLAGTLELVNQDLSISPHRLDAILKGAEEFLSISPDRPSPRDIWRGLRPCTPDGVPLVGSSKRISNLFYCTGHQMLGLQSAPGTARLAAQLLTGQAPFVDPSGFDPRRFE
jgi:D-amino-acid dehydrogenase